MKTKIFITTSLILTIFIITNLNNSNNDKEIIENNVDNTQITNINALTMMYETDYDSGEYVVSSDTTWPQDGYVFNE